MHAATNDGYRRPAAAYHSMSAAFSGLLAGSVASPVADPAVSANRKRTTVAMPTTVRTALPAGPTMRRMLFGASKALAIR